jgi:hypothetical protein
VGGFISAGQIFGAFFEAPGRAEKLVLFFVGSKSLTGALAQPRPPTLDGVCLVYCTGSVGIWLWSTCFGSSSVRSRPFELSFLNVRLETIMMLGN